MPIFSRATSFMHGKLGGAGHFKPTGNSARLLLVDAAMDTGNTMFSSVDHSAVHHVVYDSRSTTAKELISLIRECHKQNNGLFESIGVANYGPNPQDLSWKWATDLVVDMADPKDGMRALESVIACMCAALGKTAMGSSHIDLIAPGLSSKKGGNHDLIVELEKLYCIDFRASIRNNDALKGKHAWKLSTDNNYNFGKHYFDKAKLKANSNDMNALAMRIRAGPTASTFAQAQGSIRSSVSVQSVDAFQPTTGLGDGSGGLFDGDDSDSELEDAAADPANDKAYYYMANVNN
jgi:hypothetical protein